MVVDSMGKSVSLPTIWEIPDDLWQRIEPVILELDSPRGKGRKRVDQRKMLPQWRHIPHAQFLPMEPLAPGVGG